MDSTTMNTISLPTKQTYKDAKKSKNLKHTEVSSTKLVLIGQIRFPN